MASLCVRCLLIVVWLLPWTLPALNYDKGEIYLMTFPTTASPYVRGVAGATDGWYQVEDGPRQTVPAYSSASTDVSVFAAVGGGVENKSVVVEARNVRIYGGAATFTSTPLPVSALGTRYIVSSCLKQLSFLVIATEDKRADVSLTLRLESSVYYDGGTYLDGDTLELSLERRQTLVMRLRSDLTGTIITSTQAIALYSGVEVSELGKPTIVNSYEQLLPVELYGLEHVVAVDDHIGGFDDTERYELQTLGEHSDTELIFNNGTLGSLTDGVFKATLVQNESFSFEATRPVMVTVCRRTRFNSGFMVIPPVSLYMTQTSTWTASNDDKFLILTDKNASDIEIKSPTLVSTDHWDLISNSSYKVGWVSFAQDTAVSLVSNSPFALLVMGSTSLYSGGYSLPRAPAADQELGRYLTRLSPVGLLYRYMTGCSIQCSYFDSNTSI